MGLISTLGYVQVRLCAPVLGVGTVLDRYWGVLSEERLVMPASRVLDVLAEMMNAVSGRSAVVDTNRNYSIQQ